MSFNSSPLRVSPGVLLCQGLVCLLHSQISGPIPLALTDSSCIFLHKIPDILQCNLCSPLLLTQWKSDGFTLCSIKICLGVALGTTLGFLRGVCGCRVVEGRIGCPTSPSFKHPAVNLSSWVHHQLPSYVSLFSTSSGFSSSFCFPELKTHFSNRGTKLKQLLKIQLKLQQSFSNTQKQVFSGNSNIHPDYSVLCPPDT